MKVPLLDLKAQYVRLRTEIRDAIDRVCEAQTFILGETVEHCERRIAQYCGVSHAVGVSSGTDALLVTLMALGVGPGDGVITTPYSFFATAGSIVRVGATPVFADIAPETFNLAPDQVRRAIEEAPKRFPGIRLKVLMPVHLFGQCADMDALLEIARDFRLRVVEDAAQAIGAEYPSATGARKAGVMGDAGCFSFFPSKNLGGFGDGGMVVTNDGELAERIRWLRNHGMHPKYHHRLVGGNFRLDALQAAVLNVKLDYLDSWHAARRENARRYDRLFSGSEVKTPVSVYEGCGLAQPHIYNQYVVRVPKRDRVVAALKDAGIGCEVYYPVPLHLQECFASLGYSRGNLPESERAANETLALPVYPELTPQMQEYVAATVLAAVEG
ncbi:MAG: DegT/DnrJ/EryC1/StrS family aminotransferase [Kiritimatiellae bacterium]|nr:DegT/DnrJ/EryC1/StrS family aminotransferase [Kiritimatiellia bacterium]